MSTLTWSFPTLARLRLALQTRRPASASADRPTCPHCGARVHPDHTSCRRCGTPQLAALQRGRPRRLAWPTTGTNHQEAAKFPRPVRAWNWWQCSEI